MDLVTSHLNKYNTAWNKSSLLKHNDNDNNRSSNNNNRSEYIFGTNDWYEKYQKWPNKSEWIAFYGRYHYYCYTLFMIIADDLSRCCRHCCCCCCWCYCWLCCQVLWQLNCRYLPQSARRACMQINFQIGCKTKDLLLLFDGKKSNRIEMSVTGVFTPVYLRFIDVPIPMSISISIPFIFAAFICLNFNDGKLSPA